MEPGGSVPQDRHDSRARSGQSRRKGKWNGCTDRPGRPVDDSLRRSDPRLRPLPPLAAVANEHRIRRPRKVTADRLRGLDRAHRLAARGLHTPPRRGTVSHRVFHLLRPDPGRVASIRKAHHPANRRERIGMDSRGYPRWISDVPARQLDHGGIGVDLDEPAMPGNVRLRPHLQSEVQLLADQNDEIRLRQNLCECAQRRIVRPARALHLNDRRPGHRRQVCEGSGSVAARHHRSRQDERRGCPSNCRENPHRVRVSHRTSRPPLEPCGGVPLMGSIHLAVDDVERQRDMHRPRTSRPCDVQRSANVVVQTVRALRGPRRLGHIARHLRLRHLLKRPSVRVRQRRAAAQERQRRIRHRCRVQRRQGVGEPGARRDQSDARPTREPSPRIRHMHRRRFLPHVQQLDLRIQAGVEHRHDLIARERKDSIHALRPQRPSNHIHPSHSA